MTDEVANPVAEKEKMIERLGAFVGKLEEEAKRRVSRRLLIEKRWLDDLRQYHGVYDPDVKKNIEKKDASKVFLNLTRPKTDAMMARLWDLLFPTDDRNWSINPTPVPTLTKDSEYSMEDAQKAREAAERSSADAAAATENNDPQAAAMLVQQATAQEEKATLAQEAYDKLFEVQQEAKERAELMQEEIDDQLRTCRYQAESRDMIGDACKIGTGVLKGPVLNSRPKQRWEETTLPDGTPQHTLETVADNMPAAQWVDPWSFFPDPDVRRVEDSEGFYERHLLNPQQMRKLSRRADMDTETIRSILRNGAPTDSPPSYLVDLQDLTGQNQTDVRKLHTVWEYTGPIDAEGLEVLMDADVPNAANMFRELFDEKEGEIDPLAEIEARIWFCDGKVLSFAMHPLDSNEPIYSVFNLFHDETSLFGYGIPYVMRDPQAIINGAMRMMMDNAALATGPQIVIDPESVEPYDGKWKLTAQKLWQKKKGADPNSRPFETFTIDMNQVEIANIVEMGRRLVDEMTSMPQIAQGEQGAGVTKTAQGMALLMNSANVVFRRVVRNFDDDATVPMIRRFYHWNMQFSKRSEIKGDYDVVARGSSVLLVREMQANNIMMIAQLFGDHPAVDDEKVLVEIFKAHSMSAVDIMRSKAERREHEKKQGQQQDPIAAAAMMTAEARVQEVELKKQELEDRKELTRYEWDARTRIAEMTHEAKLDQAAKADGAKRDDTQARVNDGVANRDAKERSLAVEIAMTRQTGQTAGGSV